MTHGVSVLVPSYRRPDSLQRCLDALAKQTRAADEIIVSVRESDTETAAVVDAARTTGLPVRTIVTHAEGVVAAMQAALNASRGDIVALTDDDARPVPDWIANLLAHFDTDQAIGGVGGRDWQPHERGDVHRVGMVQWFGRVIGHHHLGAGQARDVDVLKGVNCAFRAAPLHAVGFDARLRGDGAQQHWELGVCLALRRAGWRLVYDPAVAVHHDVAPRRGTDQLHRGVFAEAPLVDAVHNETVELLEGRGVGSRAVYLAWAFCIGTGEAPGLAQCARRLLQGDAFAIPRWRAAMAGRWAGIETARRAPRALSVPGPDAK
jgi:cellulose synthase/poly-beta-1,6-N-acetylglucosamine synthase-like glycosyltransferase